MLAVRFLALVIAILSSTVQCEPNLSPRDPEEWTGWGGNIYNNHWASTNKKVSSRTIQSLVPHCKVFYPKGVSATPVLKGNTVYYPTWNGLFVALDFTSCQVRWQINVTELISSWKPLSAAQRANVRSIARTSPQIDGDVVYFGTLTHALVFAVDRSTGKTLGTIQLNPHPFAIVTMSPTFYDGKLFVGAASVEENLSLDPTYKCCNFVGNVAALRFDKSTKSFSVVWNLTMIPEASAAMGWSGVGMWGSQPSIDTKRRQVFFASGNTYTVPDVIIDCQESVENITAVKQGLVPDPCLPRDILQESVISIDLDLGIINWVHQLPALDAFSAACGYPGLFPQNKTLCPQVPGLDYDFGMAPSYVPGSKSTTPHGKDMVVVGQKSGIIYGMSAQTGILYWSTQTSPGGLGGGLSWGVAADDERAYFTGINWGFADFHLVPSGQLHNRSVYGAVELSSGKILWQTPVPGNGTSYSPPGVVGDLVLVGKTGSDPNATQNYDTTNGSLIAMDRTTGRVVLDYVLDTNIHSAVAVWHEYVLFGLGYDGFQPSATVPGSITVMKVGGK